MERERDEDRKTEKRGVRRSPVVRARAADHIIGNKKSKIGASHFVETNVG